MPTASINPQLTSALLGGGFVSPEDPRDTQANWLALQAKRNALKQQDELHRAQVDNYNSQVANRQADNDRQQAAGLVQAAQKKAADAKAAEDAALKAKNDQHIAAFRLIASADPKNPAGMKATADDLHSKGMIDDEDYQGLTMTPGERWRDVGMQGIAHVGGETALKGFLDDEATLAGKKATDAKATTDTAKTQAELDKAKADQAAYKERLAAFATEKGLPVNAQTEYQMRLQEDRDSAAAKRMDAKPKEDVNDWIATIATGTPAQKAEAQKKLDLHIQTIKAGRPVTGGGTGDGKPLSQQAIKDLSARKSLSDQVSFLADNVKPEYFGHAIGGNTANAIGELTGGVVGSDPDQVQWHKDYSAWVNQVRHDLFGSALTPQEKKAFDAAIITTRTSPENATKFLDRQKKIAADALSRQARVYESGGYSKGQISEYAGGQEATQAATPKAAPKVGDKKQHQGHTYMFTGKEWELQ